MVQKQKIGKKYKIAERSPIQLYDNKPIYWPSFLLFQMDDIFFNTAD